MPRFGPKRYKSKGGKRHNARTYKKRKGKSPVAKLKRSVRALQDATKTQYSLTWARAAAPICPLVAADSTNASAAFVYICPIPSSSSETEDTFSDNMWTYGATTPSMAQKFTKTPLWSMPRDTIDKADIRHTGSVITYRLMGALVNVQRTFKVLLISPGHAFADQLIDKRHMKELAAAAGSVPGSASILANGYDFTYNPPDSLVGTPKRILRGWTMNKRMWNVHYENTITLGQPETTGSSRTVSIEKMVGTGFIKVPGKGRSQRIWQTDLHHDPGDDVEPREPVQETKYINQQNEKAMFLVVMGQTPSGPNGSGPDDPDWRPTLQFNVRDRFTARDGTLGQKPNAGAGSSYRTPQRPNKRRR